MSELIDACFYNDIELALNLIENGANVNLQNKCGEFALMWSYYHNNTEIILKLIENGANLDLQDDSYRTAILIKLCQRNNIKIISYLLEQY